MCNKKIYFSSIIGLCLGFSNLNAQDLTLFDQQQQSNGTAISGSSSVSRSIHIADDFILNDNSKLTKITLEGAQIYANLASILRSVDFYIVEGEILNTEPGSENVVYQSVDSLDGIILESSGMVQDFMIDLSSKNVNLQANKKYWIIFSANINAPYPSNLTDWHNYPGVNTSGTSLARTYTNGAWSNLVSGLTFKIEGKNVLGTSELFSNKTSVFAETLVSHNLNIIAKDFESILVYDSTGRLAITSRKSIVEVSGLASGTYFGLITLKNGKKITSKFIKK
ncbi:Por secretion system C-terminal sorting domain-containing protein [Soonwooa buanensis]|uniref:Por secretion system C-terminal sorting domain-containing protein n=1 Tax=Soonwooa buanensis TaxID=619805 RepID=A0A1T5FHW9_9FLAO|nr:T9SS type A sorting domain-containing protein [Soonwooa buanensis]SKB95678.1 Por secretion system C-terminal sorting domain-containing protein [Soonwooa buanensis]